MKYYISNAFSLNMIPASMTLASVNIHKVTAAGTTELLLARPFTSVVGHKETAAVFTDVLSVPVEFNRETVTLAPGDRLIVGQYTGPRLPEGATTLPEGASIRWLCLEISTLLSPDCE